MYTDDELMQLPIRDAVSYEAGGNGLASRVFTPRSGIFWLRWQRVVLGHEVAIVDGVLQERQRLKFEPGRIIGLRPQVQRVVLKPPPLESIEAEAFTSDGLKTRITVSIKYNVLDPIEVAKEADAILSLKKYVIAAIREYIPRKTQFEIVSDTEHIHSTLLAEVSRKYSVKGIYGITDLICESVATDERIIDLSVETTLAIGRKDLTEAVEDTEDISFAREMRRREASSKLEDYREEIRKRADHEREMEKLELEGRVEIEKGRLKLSKTLLESATKSKIATGDSGADELLHIAETSTSASPPSGRLKLPKSIGESEPTTEETHVSLSLEDDIMPDAKTKLVISSRSHEKGDSESTSSEKSDDDKPKIIFDWDKD